uniref:Putative gtpase-activating protein n=1 Tax=Panstrongylus lignarius TaxID=156445 RepID=A0A224XQ24_9HEMI
MSTKAEKDRQKQIQDKCQNLLTQMLRDEDNKYCVDCDAKGPRWASWNLGIFLCIRCAGIHRNLGVHISKVKSVNLDSWTPSQVVSLQQMGNSRARAVYEANLPETFRRPQTDSALESFIRAKYEAKKYIAQEWVPSPLPQVNWDKELDEESERARRKKRESKGLSNMQVPVRKKIDNIIPQPLAKPTSSSPKSSNRHSNSALQAPALLSLDTPTNDDAASGEDLFTSFLSADDTNSASGIQNAATASATVSASSSPAASSTKRSEEEENFFNQTSLPSSGTTGGKLDKDSILALYSKGPPQTSFAPGLYQSQPQMTAFPVQQPQLYQGYNGVAQPVQTQANVYQQQIPVINPASNPFYSMSASLQHNKLAEQMATLNMGTQRASSNPSLPGHTLTNNLWQ